VNRVESLRKKRDIKKFRLSYSREMSPVIKKILAFLLLISLAVLFWFAFAVWTGLYSIYSIPPSPAEPDGSTLIVAREEGEPMFNSPQYKPPPKKVEPSGGIGFGSGYRPKRSLDQRTIVELPYVEWAYKKSLEPAPEETPAN
jgi:hypothetical protein